MNTTYSGRTTAYKHKHTKWRDLDTGKPSYKGDGGKKDDIITDYEKNPDYLTNGKLDWNKVPHEAKPAIQNRIVFEVQWSDCPVEVAEEVSELWQNKQYGNDSFYYQWDETEDKSDYPIIAEYLKSKNIKDCLIHFWW